MADFYKIAEKISKNSIEVYPKFVTRKTKDLMIKGGDFYAVWDEANGLWSTDEDVVIRIIDDSLTEYVKEKVFEGHANVKYMWDADTGSIDRWHKYCKDQLRDNYHMLNEKLIFANDPVRKEDYSSKRLDYPLEPCETPGYDKLMSTLYDEENRHKIEWAIGSIITGDSKKLQKFLVLYGSAGTGKSTVLNIIQELFKGYYTVFDAKALGSASAQFALEPFKNGPLVAIQHDGDLSRIEDNTRLNSLVSHEEMTVNEKFKSAYTNRFKCFLFMGTNKPVKITDAKSGLVRRLIDVKPSGNKLSMKEYKAAVEQIKFELGGIACHCRDVYLENKSAYDDYYPTEMFGATNDFYNFIEDSYSEFLKNDGIRLTDAWKMYDKYADDANLQYKMTLRVFKEELKNYFKKFEDRAYLDDGTRPRSYYSGFKIELFEGDPKKPGGENSEKPSDDSWIIFKDYKETNSYFDNFSKECPAQYANSKGTPVKKWDNCDTKLADVDSTKLHYVKLPENHIVIDFDIKGPDGKKSLERNIEAASKWKPTYAELSKSGSGIHLHYIYNGDVNKLSRLYSEDIEIKVFTGNSSLRRMLTKCTANAISTIASGLPFKEGDKMINKNVMRTEKGLRKTIEKCLRKEVHSGTKPNIDMIKFALDEMYESGQPYDVSDMYNDILAFALQSTNQSEYCVKLVGQMKFKSEEPSESLDIEAPIIFYDVEVFPNLFIICWKLIGEGHDVVRMINPSPEEVNELLKYRLIGFNCRRYDNHILYARINGYDNTQLYNLSQKLIDNDKNAYFREAYNLSYTDIYDFCSKKQSLKKWEIELDIKHKELGLPWDQPVPEYSWERVASYCDNDVLATEEVFNARQADFVARQIQVDLVKILHGIDASVNDTTNTLSTKIIFGKERKPQNAFNWRDLSEPVGSDRYEEYRTKFGPDYKFRVFDANGLPAYRDYIPGEDLPEGWSILPFFKGYTFKDGKSIFMDQSIGEGGRVYSEPGMYCDVWDGDIASQHPHSAIYEVIFGPEYTKRFEDVVYSRVAIKHKDFEKAGSLLGGALKPYLNEDQAKDLAQALKIVINSIYGLTSASFENPFRDPNNIDNIVAKRGALFMTLLKSEVEKLGYTVAHIKTDSIKIPNADEKIIKFVTDFGNEYGYSFETEEDFEKFCLVNDAVYIAKTKDGKWTATGKQFAVPYVFKTLFSREPIVFADLCETFAVTKGDLYLDLNEDLDNEEVKERLRKRIKIVQDELDRYDENDPEYNEKTIDIRMHLDNLKTQLETGHNYKFVGRIGQFTPVKPGKGGGTLYRIKDGKAYAAPGSKGYLWIETNNVSKEYAEAIYSIDGDVVDRSYYDKLVNDAIDTLSKYGDVEQFRS